MTHHDAVRIEEVRYGGHECIRLRSGSLDVLVTHSVGPRVISLRHVPGDNVLAVLPDAHIDTPGQPPFRLVGGHRLWIAPEEPAVTYVPDDQSVDVTTSARSVSLTSVIDDTTGIAKTMTITMNETHTRIDHELRNEGRKRRLAPWAITQLRPGGRVLIPLGSEDSHPLQAKANVVVWPYTRLDDPAIIMHRGHIELSGTRSDATKVGTTLLRGWLAYRLDDLVFIKRATTQRDTVYPDLGASGQVYVSDSFVELETLGPLVDLPPGETVSHTELWELHVVDRDQSDADLIAAIDAGDGEL